MFDILDCFHHIHHKNGSHEVHHCGGEHNDEKLDYNIRHCACGKHLINKPKAIGHDIENKETEFIFSEECPEGGWHIESGKINQ